ncbi:hypothetical protein J4409_01740 [Candidatus Woesearchaeota archaeon]|nr:hypothetical protein [Candidatus Woesearchaeota archaeon]
MPIISFNYGKMLIEKKKDQIKGDVKVKNDLVLQSLTLTDIDIGKKKQEVIKLNFEFLTEYQPGLGNISIGGTILFLESADNIKLITDMWKKEKKIPQQFAANIINVILTKSNIKALELSQSVNLPPHIRLPMILPKQDFKNYIG